MTVFSELRQRRIFQIVAAYAATGWIVLEVADQLVDRGIVPEILYPVALIWYLGGFAVSLIVGWYHGEKGRQDIPRVEIAALGTVAVVALLLSGSIVFTHLEEARAAAMVDEDGVLDARRIAVLYFEDRTDDADGGYLGDALTESLISELSSVPSLDVVSRNGMALVRDRELPRDSAAALLQAGTLVEGSVEVTGQRVRIDVRLVDGNSGAEFKRGSFDRPAGQIFEAQAELAREVSLLLREWLGEEVRLRRISQGTDDVLAWQLLQRGERARKEAAQRALHGDRGGAAGSYERADSLLSLAERAQPSWTEPALLRAKIALDRAQGTGEAGERRALLENGKSHADRALELEPDHPEALELRGTLRYVEWRSALTHDPTQRAALLRSARDDLEQAVARDPERASAQAVLSHLYYQPEVRDLPGAALAAKAAYEADAFLTNANTVLYRLFLTTLDMGQFAQASGWCAEGVRRFPEDPRFARCRLLLMSTPGATPDAGEAWAVLDELEGLAPDGARHRLVVEGRMFVAGALAREGLPDSARAVLARAHDDYVAMGDPHQGLLGIEAYVSHVLGDDDRAIDLLKVYATANHGFEAGGDVGWMWQGLRSHPRFREIVTRRSERH